MGMPKCPKCGEEIDRLYYKVVDYGTVWLKENGELDWELASETYGDEQKSACEFKCPKCHAVIFDDEDEAVEFLTS
jgi:predicted RNA-binding Zn-ribbon protein involved in translation (DUF1610 family)